MGLYTDMNEMCIKIAEIPDAKFYDYEEAMKAWKKYKNDLADRRAAKKQRIREDPPVSLPLYIRLTARDKLKFIAKGKGISVGALCTDIITKWLTYPQEKRGAIASEGTEHRKQNMAAHGEARKAITLRIGWHLYKNLSERAEDFDCTVSRVITNILYAYLVEHPAEWAGMPTEE